MGNSVSVNAVPEQSWSTACANAFTSQNLTEGLVDKNGHPTGVFNNQTWGITHQACYDVCGPDKMYQAFNFTTFAAALPNWLLPWLALTAQLPYGASGPGSNVMSGLMAIGSPALITYSLSLTILNRYWIRRRLGRLKRASQPVKYLAPHISGNVSAAMELLQDAQQAPLRVSQEDGWLSSLVVLRENQAFWKTVKRNLRITRRGLSASLFAQMLMASIAYLLVIVDTFLGSLGNSKIALQLASGSLWVWMIPVILGWILVGTQSGAGAIGHAIRDDDRRARRALPDADSKHEFVVTECQRGIIVQSDMNNDHIKPPDWLGCNVAGDEEEEGPIYNYSRIFTWFQCAIQIESSFSQTLIRLHQNSSERVGVDGKPWPDSAASTKDHLAGSSSQVAKYCGLPLTIHPYIHWSHIPAKVWHHIIFASFVALFVQWGTTGPAIMIAYLTPTKGLGCRAGSYLLYGSAATIAWALLTCSSFLSHAVMLRYQGAHVDRRHKGTGHQKDGHTLLCSLAVCTRYLGKAIAVVNAGWLVVFCLLEYIGTFETCWCKVSRGWVGVFGDASETAAVALKYWASGLALSLMVCALSLAFFCLASTDMESESGA